MQIAPGTQLGPYVVLSRLGAGGMGEVWRARDTRLDREIAIKVLPAELAADTHFRLRFEHEARTISQLNHPNICTLYDVGDGYLVMELLDGVPLADRVQKGPLPFDQVLRYGIEIAAALDRAHRSGIVHRDLKPGNVMITREGAKLLDFGLAKSSPLATAVSQDRATEHRPLTAEGTIVGTFQYMAPEQIEGREADARSDLFALGAVLYEMATGRRAFDGKSKASLIASILDRDPPPISDVQPLAPSGLDYVIRKCLAKDPEQRWQSAHDVRLQLQWIAESGGEPAVRTPRGRAASAVIAVAALIAGLALGAAVWRWREGRTTRRAIHFSIPLPDTARLMIWGQAGVAVSPDGRTLVFPAGAPTPQLYVRTLDSDEITPLDGTIGASRPFFSPDGQWIAFGSGNSLKKIPRDGGAAQVLAPLDGVYVGGTWVGNSKIVYATLNEVLRINADGSGRERLFSRTGVTPFLLGGNIGHRAPFAIPGGDLVLFETSDVNAPKISVLSLESKKWETVTDGSGPFYVDRIHALLFTRNGTVFAARFDPKRGKLSGPAVPVIQGVTLVPPYGFVEMGVSPAGTVVFARGNLTAPPRTLVTVDRKGIAQPVSALVRGFEDPRISPDGKRIAATIRSTSDTDVWLLDVARSILTRRTFDKGEEETPIWTPDGQRITYGAERGVGANSGAAGLMLPAKTAVAPNIARVIASQPFDGSAPERVLLNALHAHCGSWSPDGKTLAYTDYRTDFTGMIWTWSAADGAKRAFVSDAFNVRAPAFSRDGRWIAYTSNESGRDEVYVRPFPGPGPVVQVSSEGGGEAVWSRKGDELFFRNGNGLYSARVQTGAAFSADPPQLLFTGDFVTARRGEPAYDVMPDGEHFLMVAEQPNPLHQRLNVIVDWLDEVETKLEAAEKER